MACLPSSWWDMEYVHTHSTGLQNEHFKDTLVQHGAAWCMYVDDVLFDASFRPKATDAFLRVPLGRERTGGMFLRCSFPGIGFYNPRLGLALVLS